MTYFAYICTLKVVSKCNSHYSTYLTRFRSVKVNDSEFECILLMTESTNTHKSSYIYTLNTFNVFEKCFYNFYFINYELNM